jgi:hypothetical protein
MVNQRLLDADNWPQLIPRTVVKPLEVAVWCTKLVLNGPNKVLVTGRLARVLKEDQAKAFQVVSHTHG